jgi:putative transposase
VLRQLVEAFANALMSAEADAVRGAPYGEVSAERVNRRNGYRGPPFDTRVGSVELRIPKLRTGSYFPDWLLERRQRAETALTTVVATCYLLGVSTRRLERLAEALGITRLSKSQVSEMAKELDGLVESFRTRPLDQGPYRFVWADALVVKVREGGSIVGVHVLIATGVNAEGRREILGCEVTAAEDGAGWLAFFRSLVARGLHGVQLVTSDAHPGLVAAIRATLPGASWQRCRTHYLRELLTKVAKSSQPWVATMVRTIFDQPDATEVKAQFDRVVETLEAKLPVAAAHLQEAREDLLAFSCFPRQIWRRSGAPTPKNGSTARSDAGPTWSGSFPTAARSFASSAPCSWNRPTSGPSRAAPWELRFSPRSTRPLPLPPAPTLPRSSSPGPPWHKLSHGSRGGRVHHDRGRGRDRKPPGPMWRRAAATQQLPALCLSSMHRDNCW